MMRVFLLLSITVMLFARGYHAPDNRSQVKNIIKMLHLDHKMTWLNGCAYSYDVTSCMDKTIIDTSTCSVTEQNQTMIWIQVVPDTFYGRNMACMTKPVCVNAFSGKLFGSPMCCRRINEKYRQIESELFNLIPVTSEFAKIYQGKIFGEVKKVKWLIGNVKIDDKYIEPPEQIKGDIARVYLYMDERYGLQISLEQKELFRRWHRLDAVDKRECALAKIIMKVQNRTNHLITEGCKK